MAQVYSIKFFIALFPYRVKIQDIFKRFYVVLSFKKKKERKKYKSIITRIYDILCVLDKKHH